MALGWIDGRVEEVRAATLTVGPSLWTWAHDRHDAIVCHWTLATAQNPAFFNGAIYLIDQIECRQSHVTARLLKTDFQSYLYWRDQGFPKEAGVIDGFGSGLIRSAEGHVLLGRQRKGNVNGGLAYPPGGFIDARDANASGVIDIGASVRREIAEETGLRAADYQETPGLRVTFAGAHVSFALEVCSSLPSAALAQTIKHHLSEDPRSELEDIVIIKSARDIEGLAMPHFAKVLLASLFHSRP